MLGRDGATIMSTENDTMGGSNEHDGECQCEVCTSRRERDVESGWWLA